MNYLKWVFYVFGLLVIPLIVPLALDVSFGILICWDEIVIGPVTAVIVVCFGYFAAPRFKIQGAFLSFLIGCYFAWAVVERWYPECHVKAYEKTQMVLWLTCTVGALTLASLIAINVIRRSRQRVTLKRVP